MDYDKFVGMVQNRARLATSGEAIRAIHATFQTLSERLQGGEPGDLAAQLPKEIGDYLLQGGGTGERFSIDEFYQRVTMREGADLPRAVFHARAVMSVVMEAVSPGEIADIRAQLPDEYNQLFQPEQPVQSQTGRPGQTQ